MESYFGFWVDNHNKDEDWVVDSENCGHTYSGGGHGNFSGLTYTGDGFGSYSKEDPLWFDNFKFYYFDDATDGEEAYTANMMRYK